MTTHRQQSLVLDIGPIQLVWSLLESESQEEESKLEESCRWQRWFDCTRGQLLRTHSLMDMEW
jgi:hypothetical protein